MNLVDLTDDEQVALVALVVQLMRSDGETSEDELTELSSLGAEMGLKRFDAAYVRAREALGTREAALAFAQSHVQRPAARELIHTVLYDMAAADGVDEEERALVSTVRAMWEIVTIPR
jgi:uncharacterized tellurite resistance protein B-like protein